MLHEPAAGWLPDHGDLLQEERTRLFIALILTSFCIAGAVLAQNQNIKPTKLPPHDPELMRKVDAFQSKVMSCWTPPAGSQGRRISVNASLNKDGTLSRRPTLVDAAKDQITLAIFERAVMTLERCQPYDMLPLEKHELWNEVQFVFETSVAPGVPAPRPLAK